MNLAGWAGRILHVDLTSRKVESEPLSRERAVDGVGGRGLGMPVLFDEVGPGVDALSPGNIIFIGQGPLGGTLSPTACRTELVFKSPLTGIFGRSNVGGFFGPELKWAGYDAIVIRGQAARPVYLWIHDDEVQLKDATALWGKDTWATERLIRDELGDHAIRTLKIGPAGENLCYSAAVIGDLSRAAAKCGVGAVWGAKRLKAIAVRGTRGVRIARRDDFLKLDRGLTERLKTDPMYATHSRYGRNEWVGDALIRAYGTPMPNISAAGLSRLYKRNYSCSGCALHCAHLYNIKTGRYPGTRGGGVEGNCQFVGVTTRVDDGEFLLHFNMLCNQLGVNLDVPGYALNWAMRLYEDGVISRVDTDGFELAWGNQGAVLEMTRKIARKEGFGAVLDAYPVRAAAMLGRGSELYMAHGKGQYASGAGFMSSVKTTLAHAVATRGWDHLTGSPGSETPNRRPEITMEVLAKLGEERYGDPEYFTDGSWKPSAKKARRVYDHEHQYCITDLTGICRAPGQSPLIVAGFTAWDYAKLLTAVTGEEFSEAQLVRAAEREFAMERAYNAREGIRRVDDYPYVFWWQSKHGRPHPKFDPAKYRMTLQEYDELLDDYYRLRGCSLQTGIPTTTTFERLGLRRVADDLRARGILPQERKLNEEATI